MPRVLVIEDDAQVRRMLRQTLEEAGCEVAEAPDGDVGLQLFRQQPADVVITDILMPEKEGIETIISLQREFPHVEIIAISGGGRLRKKDCLNWAAQLGTARTFAKPLELNQLVEAVHELASRAQA